MFDLITVACLFVIFTEVGLRSIHQSIRAADSAGAGLLMCEAALCRVLPDGRLHSLCECRSQLDHKRPGHRCRISRCLSIGTKQSDCLLGHYVLLSPLTCISHPSHKIADHSKDHRNPRADSCFSMERM